MKLYYAIPSTYSQKVLLAIYEKGLEVEKIPVNLMDPASAADYKANVYELGKIPLLIGENDRRVPESSIIIEYLEQTFPDSPRLFPSEPTACREVRFKDRMCDLYVNDSVANLFFQSMKPEAQQNPELIAKCKANLDFMYARMDGFLASNEYIAGSEFTIADCAAVPALFYAQELYPFSGRKNIVNYFERINQRTSYQRILEELMPALAAMKGE